MPHILIVEDERAISDLLKDILEDEGYTVMTAEHGRDALARVAENPPHIILTDVMMPIMDGITLCRLLEVEPAYRAIPVVLMTAAQNLDVERIRCAAAIRKPFALDVLLDTIARVLGEAMRRT